MTRKKLTAKQLNKDLGIELNEVAVSKLGIMHIADVYVLTRILESVNGFIVAQSTKGDVGLTFFLNEEGWIQTNEITEDGNSSLSFETYQDLRDHLLENIEELSEVNVVLVTSKDVVEDAYEEGVLLDEIVGEDVLEDDEAKDKEVNYSLEYSLEDVINTLDGYFDKEELDKLKEKKDEVNEDILEMTLEEFEEFLYSLSKEEDEESDDELDEDEAVKFLHELFGTTPDDEEEDKETLFNDSFDRNIAYFKDGLNFEVVGIDRNTKLPADQYYVVIQAFDKNGEIIEEEKSDLMQDFSINDLINETEMATEFKQLSGKDDFSHFIMKKVVSKKDERAIWSLK